MKTAVRAAKAPIFFFQAGNDFDLSPSKVLFEQMQQAELEIYPAFGRSPRNGRAFAYRGSALWFPDVLAFIELHCAG